MQALQFVASVGAILLPSLLAWILNERLFRWLRLESDRVTAIFGGVTLGLQIWLMALAMMALMTSFNEDWGYSVGSAVMVINAFGSICLAIFWAFSKGKAPKAIAEAKQL